MPRTNNRSIANIITLTLGVLFDKMIIIIVMRLKGWG